LAQYLHKHYIKNRQKYEVQARRRLHSSGGGGTSGTLGLAGSSRRWPEAADVTGAAAAAYVEDELAGALGLTGSSRRLAGNSS